MATDTEAKRLAHWKTASKKYCDLLEEMVMALRDQNETVPATPVLKALTKKSIVIEKAGKIFREDVDRAVASAPEPPSQYGF